MQFEAASRRHPGEGAIERDGAEDEADEQHDRGQGPDGARATVTIRMAVNARPIYGTNAPSKATRPGARERHAQHTSERPRGPPLRRPSGGPADVATDLIDRAPATVHQGLAAPTVGRGQQPVPGLVPVHQQEERQESTEDGDRDDVRRRADDVSEPGQDDPRDRLQRCAGGWSSPRPGRRVRSTGPGRPPIPASKRSTIALTDGTTARTISTTAAPSTRTAPPARRRQPPWRVLTPRAPRRDVRGERGSQDQREDDRRRDHGKLHGDPEQDDPEGERDQDPPADSGQAHQPAWNSGSSPGDRRVAAGEFVNHAAFPSIRRRRPAISARDASDSALIEPAAGRSIGATPTAFVVIVVPPRARGGWQLSHGALGSAIRPDCSSA